MTNDEKLLRSAWKSLDLSAHLSDALSDFYCLASEAEADLFDSKPNESNGITDPLEEFVLAAQAVDYVVMEFRNKYLQKLPSPPTRPEELPIVAQMSTRPVGV